MIDLLPDERLDDLQCKGYHIIQNTKSFCFGIDAVLLANYAKHGVKPGQAVLDMGTGTGVIPILLAAKTEAAHLTGLEIQTASAQMAARSVALNAIEDRVRIVEGDIKEAGNIFPAASFHVITCNPPYMTENHGLHNPYEAKNIARHEVLCTLEDVIAAAAKLLVPGGSFYMVHKPFRLAEIMEVMVRYKLEPKQLQMVHPYVDKEPNMILIQGVRGGKSRIKIAPPLILSERAPGN